MLSTTPTPNPATIRSNVTRWATHYGLAEHLAIFKEQPDRVWAVYDLHFLDFLVKNKWTFSDPPNHGDGYLSAREPGGVRPALQVVYHQGENSVTCEIDFDYASPAGFPGIFIHVGEVLWNFFTGAKTDQEKIARGLTKRGIP